MCKKGRNKLTGRSVSVDVWSWRILRFTSGSAEGDARHDIACAGFGERSHGTRNRLNAVVRIPHYHKGRFK